MRCSAGTTAGDRARYVEPPASLEGTPAAADLWQAVKDSGFTPVRIDMGDSVYKGPNPQ